MSTPEMLLIISNWKGNVCTPTASVEVNVEAGGGRKLWWMFADMIVSFSKFSYPGGLCAACLIALFLLPLLDRYWMFEEVLVVQTVWGSVCAEVFHTLLIYTNHTEAYEATVSETSQQFLSDLNMLIIPTYCSRGAKKRGNKTLMISVFINPCCLSVSPHT